MANDKQIQQQATLGCGSLILIALIVIIFSKSSADELQKEIKSLESEVKELKQSIEYQSTQIKDLRVILEKAKAQ